MKKRIQKNIALLLSIILVIGLLPAYNQTVKAETSSGTCGDGVYWELDTETGFLRIYGNGKMSNYSTSQPWRELSISEVKIESGVTSIGKNAFFLCDSISSLTIPDSVTTIGEYAFKGCSALTNVTIPDSVINIGGSAFSGCSSLTSITIPHSVISIGDGAFYECSNLGAIKVDENNRTYDSRNDCNAIIKKSTNQLIAGCYNTIIPDSVTSIGGHAFGGCDRLENIIIPDSVTNIGKNAFIACSSLKSILIPNGITSIEEHTFAGCSSLTGISIPDGITSIGANAFNGCSNLMRVTIPTSVTDIYDYAFYDCDRLFRVWYGGTESELNELRIVENGNSALLDAIECCSHSLKDTGIMVEPTCTQQGHKVYNCSTCGYDFIKYIEETEHNCDSWTIITNATCTTEGQRKGLCRECNNWIYETIEVLAHNYVDEIVNPTRTEQGYTLHTCLDCKYSFKDTYIDWFQVYEEGKCGNNISWLLDKKTWVLTITGSGAMYNYDPIIASDFTLSTTTPWGGYEANIVKVEISSGITSIGNGAFCGFSSIPAITIPTSVINIGDYAFYDCNNITSMVIPKGVTNIGEYAFYGCGELESITIPDSIMLIDDYAFEDCEKLLNTYYEGNKEDWSFITMGVGNRNLIGALIFHTHTYTDSVKKPTCIEQGYTVHKCTECGDSYVDTYTSTTMHNFGTWEITKQATYTEEGIQTRKCSICDKTETKTIAKLEGNVDVENPTTTPEQSTTTKQDSNTTNKKPAKVNFKLKAGKKKVTIKWNKVKGARGYTIYYKTSKKGSWKKVKNVSAKKTKYVKKKLKKGKTYYFTVKAYKIVNGKKVYGKFKTKRIKVKK